MIYICSTHIKQLQPRYVKVESLMIFSDFSDHLRYEGLQGHKKNPPGTGKCIVVAKPIVVYSNALTDCLNEPAGRLLLVIVVSLTLCHMSRQPVILAIQGDQICIQSCDRPDGDGGKMDATLVWIGV